uniref:DNA damage-regulated autophagy modulator protein 2 n=1 Tax=Panagrolaimus sp. ES5 TaxID=591445 RepID=A0AC34FG93_9BILA
MPLHALWLFPVLTTVFGILAFVIGYAIAVSNGYENAWFSYISDGGTHPPESCIFGQLLNLSAACLAVSVYLRHRQYVVFYEHHLGQKRGWWRTVSSVLMFIGYFAAFGMSMVANFQETSVGTVHFIGAMIGFFGSTIYVWGQIILSFTMLPRMTPIWLNSFRVIFTTVATGALILHMICEQAQPFVKTDANGIKPTEPPLKDGIKRYAPGNPYYVNHIYATVAEWVLALALEIVLLSYAFELRSFFAHMPKLQLVESFLATSVRSVVEETPQSLKRNGISMVMARTLTGSAKVSDSSSNHIPR